MNVCLQEDTEGIDDVPDALKKKMLDEIKQVTGNQEPKRKKRKHY